MLVVMFLFLSHVLVRKDSAQISALPTGDW